MLSYAGRKGKRHEDSVDQRRQTYQPPGEEKSLTSDVPKNTKTLVEVSNLNRVGLSTYLIRLENTDC